MKKSKLRSKSKKKCFLCKCCCSDDDSEDSFDCEMDYDHVLDLGGSSLPLRPSFSSLLTSSSFPSLQAQPLSPEADIPIIPMGNLSLLWALAEFSSSTFASYGVKHGDCVALLRAMPPSHRSFYHHMKVAWRGVIGGRRVVASHAGIWEGEGVYIPDKKKGSIGSDSRKSSVIKSAVPPSSSSFVCTVDKELKKKSKEKPKKVVKTQKEEMSITMGGSSRSSTSRASVDSNNSDVEEELAPCSVDIPSDKTISSSSSSSSSVRGSESEIEAPESYSDIPDYLEMALERISTGEDLLYYWPYCIFGPETGEEAILLSEVREKERRETLGIEMTDEDEIIDKTLLLSPFCDRSVSTSQSVKDMGLSDASKTRKSIESPDDESIVQPLLLRRDKDKDQIISSSSTDVSSPFSTQAHPLSESYIPPPPPPPLRVFGHFHMFCALFSPIDADRIVSWACCDCTDLVQYGVIVVSSSCHSISSTSPCHVFARFGKSLSLIQSKRRWGVPMYLRKMIGGSIGRMMGNSHVGWMIPKTVAKGGKHRSVVDY
ncbi:hypothetical protein ADUPG1_009923 [Aduncisulcus paluster]|uniref:Uncharacterized protein n=1 Tax=Aduncisulcus paluster TaxID=2918883 RepID=A0ABQ5KX89_9EUKA|nr:hypothetical protein ADUPG1_009923 [Aduncisulcus paluster]